MVNSKYIFGLIDQRFESITINFNMISHHLDLIKTFNNNQIPYQIYEPQALLDHLQIGIENNIQQFVGLHPTKNKIYQLDAIYFSDDLHHAQINFFGDLSNTNQLTSNYTWSTFNQKLRTVAISQRNALLQKFLKANKLTVIPLSVIQQIQFKQLINKLSRNR